MAQQRLTDLGVKSAKAKGARTDIWDAECAGLVLRVTDKGRKTWFLFYRHGGKKRRVTLASANDGGLGLSEARKLARKMRDVVLGGDDPATGPKDGKPRTLAALVARYDASAEARRKRTWAEERRILAKDVLPRIGSIELDKLRKADVLTVVEAVAERGAFRTADRTARIMSAIFNWGMDEDLISLNPAQRIRRRAAAASARGRVLSNAELRSLWHSLPLIYSDVQGQLMVKLLLLTGCRKMEVQGASLGELVLDGASPAWTIPSERTKNARAHTLPLSGDALTVVREAKAVARTIHVNDDASAPLFPAPIKTKGVASRKAREQARAEAKAKGEAKAFDPGVLNRGLTRAFRTGRVRFRDGGDVYRSRPRAALLTPERAANGPFTIHDLRRTVAAQLKEMGISPDVRKAVLNHAPQGVTEIHYEAAADMQPQMATALEAWARRLRSIVEGKPSTNVVSLNRAVSG